MSRAWRRAAFVSRLLTRNGPSPRLVRSWFTRHTAAFARVTEEAVAGEASAEAHPVLAEAEGAPPKARAPSRRAPVVLTRRVRIYPSYRVDTCPDLRPSTDVLGTKEPLNRRVQLARPLDLGDVAAAQHHVLGTGCGVADVAGEGRRHHAVLCSPDEQRRPVELVKAVPEAVRVLQVDLARGGVE